MATSSLDASFDKSNIGRVAIASSSQDEASALLPVPVADRNDRALTFSLLCLAALLAQMTVT